MNSLFFIARNNIKKHKGEAAILFLLMFMAAVLLFVSLSMLMSKDNTIRKNTEEYHTPTLLVFETKNMTASVSMVSSPLWIVMCCEELSEGMSFIADIQ